MLSYDVFVLRLLIIFECSAVGTLALLFPASSVLQLVGSISVPVELQAKDQRLFFDWGFQMNYMFPYNLSQFYNVPIWSGLSKRDIVTEHVDYTVDEFYYGLAKLLKGYSLDESCLLRAVCELARHPFDVDFGNVLSELVHFILTPSLHQQFSKVAPITKRTFERAEILGRHGDLLCASAYADCDIDLLGLITKVHFD